jgi:putative glutamine amidotransferase
MIMRKPIIGLNLDFEENGGGSFHRLPWHALRSHYFDMVHQSGGTPIGLPCTNMDIDSILDIADGFLMTGGNDYDPTLYGEENLFPEHSKIMKQRSLFDIQLAQKALKKDKPILGICGGMQAINIALGGSILQHIDPCSTAINHIVKDATEPAHTVQVVAGTLLHSIVGKDVIDVNSFHHQAIKALGTGLQVNARADDGIIEGTM